MIDLYCERLEPGLWEEPWNALSNVAFFIALALLLPYYRRMRTPAGLGLLILLFTIGTGSSLFHTFATHWALQADILPILLFQLLFLGAYLRRALALPILWISAILIAFLAIGSGLQKLELPLNGSDAYLAPLLFLVTLGLLHWHRKQPQPMILLIASALFTVSLSLRTLDLALCKHWPLGTHFLWHIINASVLYLCGRAYFALPALQKHKNGN